MPIDGNYVFEMFTAPTAAAVPEPATWAMLVIGFAAAGGVVRRRRSRSNRSAPLPVHA